MSPLILLGIALLMIAVVFLVTVLESNK